MDPDVAEFPSVVIERACSPSEVLIGSGMEEAPPVAGEQVPARMLRVPLGDQVAVLDKERDKALLDLALLRRLQREKTVRVEDLNINLMPAINNQRRANESLGRALRKVLKFQCNTRTPVPSHLLVPGAPVDEVDTRVNDLHAPD